MPPACAREAFTKAMDADRHKRPRVEPPADDSPPAVNSSALIETVQFLLDRLAGKGESYRVKVLRGRQGQGPPQTLVELVPRSRGSSCREDTRNTAMCAGSPGATALVSENTLSLADGGSSEPSPCTPEIREWATVEQLASGDNNGTGTREGALAAPTAEAPQFRALEVDPPSGCHGQPLSARKRRPSVNQDVLYRFAMENVHDMISINQTDSTIVYVSPSCERIFGYKPSEMVGRKGYEFVYPEDEQTIRPQHAASIESGTNQGTFRIRRKDGTPRTVEFLTKKVTGPAGTPPPSSSASASGASSGDEGGPAPAAPAHFVCVWRDVTERQQVEEERARAERERSAREAVSQYVAYTCHELRNPVQGILGFAQLLREGAADEVQAGYAEAVVACSGLVLALLNDVLDLGRLEAGRAELREEPFALRFALETAVRVLAPYAEEKGLALALEVAGEVPEMAVGDAARLAQVLLNLISNAIKYTPSGGVRVLVGPDPAFAAAPAPPASSSPAPSPAECFGVVVRVVDTGVGIAPEELPKLFTKYSRLRASLPGGGGEGGLDDLRRAGCSPLKHSTGLGLAICKEVVGLLGGSISVRPGPGGAGSEFYFTCRFRHAPPAPAPEEAQACAPGHAALGSAASSSGCPSGRLTPDRGLGAAGAGAGPLESPLSVLVAEDNPVVQALLRRRLERLGCPCRVVGDGRAAVAEALARPYDAVLMDWVMPFLDGLAATREIRASGSRVRIVGVTANTRPEDQAMCLEAGMDMVLPKPFTAQQLRAALLAPARPASAPAAPHSPSPLPSPLPAPADARPAPTP
eukprot:tig00000498_g1611.t1